MMNLVNQSIEHVWYPCTTKQHQQQCKPLAIAKAYGSYLELQDGSRLIDATSSWWCKSLGHGHPKLQAALLTQMQRFEHVIMADTTHEVLVALSEQLTRLSPGLSKVFYASDGASAVEIALKMSLHTRVNSGELKRHRFIVLAHGYHGETMGALSVSDLGAFKAPYQSLLFQPHVLTHIPYVNDSLDPLWHDCAAVWPETLAQLECFAEDSTAIILEPIVQGAYGMRLYSQDFLSRLCAWAKQHNIHLIADEIMTGLGRTGTMLACEHANIAPDFICLAKGLTAGWLPLSAVLTHDTIYQQCYASDKSYSAFIHSHTHSGNALALSVALATLAVIHEENLCASARRLEQVMQKHMQHIAQNTGRLTQIRSIGAVIAADLVPSSHEQNIGLRFYQEAMKRGALLRPLGNTLYWFPPLNIALSTLDELAHITEAALLTLS